MQEQLTKMCPLALGIQHNMFITYRYALLHIMPLVVSFLLIGAATAQDRIQNHSVDTSVAGNEKVAEIFRTFQGRGVQSDDSQPTKASDTIKLFKMRPGFEIDLVQSEPEVSQPLFLSWDSRGRMWVVQYRQYQYPAGLKVVRFDQHLRAVFDKVPEPPPRGVKGADKITVFQDTNGDGRYDTGKDVITGLNITTSVQVGHGGIWVLNPPYLLFYPDADGDDIPDGDPEVHLSGFGLQDTHSVANSMLWGPDGWLYGANGSTTVGTVSSAVTKGVHFLGQCVWRYHPDTKIFEIYAEGGGNTFSLEIDSKGRLFSGTNGGGSRGFYYPQGSYAHKNWGKHGPLTNPYSFGFFRQMESEGDTRRFPQAFSIYEGGLFPARFDGAIIAPNAMQNLVWLSQRLRKGSTYRTIDEQNLLESSDRWFRPVYCGVGPDGAVYIADWYDTRLSHVSPVDNWHKESGRIYRIYPGGLTPKYVEGDLRRLDSLDLIAKFDHPNKWIRRRAMLELGWRGDSSVVGRLIQLVDTKASLESLWALNLLEELTTERALPWLYHDDEDIRRWVVRLLGDRHEGNLALAHLASREPEVQVRSQLASTAKRIDAQFALPIVEQLLQRDEDLSDPHLPLLIWWAIEAHAENWPAIENMFSKPDLWKLPMVRKEILGRIMQRYAASGSPTGLEHCVKLVALAPDDESRELLAVGLNKAFQGRAIPTLPKLLDETLVKYQASRGKNRIILALRQGKSGSIDLALKALRDTTVDLGLRIELTKTLGEIYQPKGVDSLLRLATGRDTTEPALQRVAIRSLALYDDARIPKELIRGFGGAISAEYSLRSTGCRTLASRESWAKALLREVNQWRLKKSDIPADVIQLLRTYKSVDVIAAVQKAFGEPVAISASEKINELHRLTELLRTSKGDAENGKQIFVKQCATCHKLFGEGEQIGPPLDGYDRANLKFWLPAIIEPSLEIREGYQSYSVITNDGRVITGMIAEQNPKTVTLRTADLQFVIIARDKIDELQAIRLSLMPDNLLKSLSDKQIKDLFAYLALGTQR